MKMKVALFALLVSASALAADIKITSFIYVSNTSRVAELCGVVTENEGHAHIRVTVDHKSSRPGIYNTIAGKDGKFCMIVHTFSGLAEAKLFDDAKSVAAKIQ